MSKSLLFALLLVLGLISSSWSQSHLRTEQKTLRLRIDLRSVENRQLAGSNPLDLPRLLVQHFTEGHYEGRWPWELSRIMPLNEFREFMDKHQAAWPLGDDTPPIPCQCQASTQQTEAIPIGTEHDDLAYDLAPIIDLIEEHSFDRTLGRDRIRTQFIVLYYRADNGLDHPAVAFRYPDVRLHTLNRCRWLNRVQEPAELSLEQILKLRLFQAVILDESGREPHTYDEAERLRLRRIEAEGMRYEY